MIQTSRPRRVCGSRPLVLVVKADAPAADDLSSHLADHGFQTGIARDGADALARWEAARPDVVLLDLLLGDMSGLEVCCRLGRRTRVPIVMLTSEGSPTEPEVGLDLGADDYVTWPGRQRELIARLRAVLRCANGHQADAYVHVARHCGDLHLEPGGCDANVAEHRVQLLPKEYELVELLVENAGRTVAKEMLALRLWGARYGDSARQLEAMVQRLRHKLDPDRLGPSRIVTERGRGYRYEPPSVH
jgi:two-component system, OmpR family, response regulator RegX3